MNFTMGSTRWVILTRKYAIKIPRIRPILAVRRFFQCLQKGEVRAALRKYHKNILFAGLKYLLAGPGLKANRTERVLSRRHGEDGTLMPTVWSLGPFVNVQPRGEPALEDAVCDHWLQKFFPGTPKEQFCVWKGRGEPSLVLVDYGDEGLSSALATRGK
jgi:hypothetical protein